MKMITIPAICKKGEISVMTLHRLRRAGLFPPPRLVISRKLMRWDEDEVDSFFGGNGSLQQRGLRVIVSLINNKGGVGKTTSTVSLAHALGNRGKKVLVVDNDPQSNATSLLLGDIEPALTLYDALIDGVAAPQCIYTPADFANGDHRHRFNRFASLFAELGRDHGSPTLLDQG